MSFKISHNVNHSLIPSSVVHINDKGHADINREELIQARDGGVYGFSDSSTQKFIRFDINSNHEAWKLAESELEFELELTAGTTGYLDGSAHTLFNRMRLLTKNGTCWDMIRDPHPVFRSPTRKQSRSSRKQSHKG